MKVLLVQPPLTPEIELYSTAGIVAPPLGLAYLAAVLAVSYTHLTLPTKA